MIFGMLIASPTKGYFVGYDGWGDNTLYPFNPATGVVGEALKDFQQRQYRRDGIGDLSG